MNGLLAKVIEAHGGMERWKADHMWRLVWSFAMTNLRRACRG